MKQVFYKYLKVMSNFLSLSQLIILNFYPEIFFKTYWHQLQIYFLNALKRTQFLDYSELLF